MEHRRFSCPLPSRSLCRDTLLAPQLEDYDVFRANCWKLTDSPPLFQLVLNVAWFVPREIELSFPEDKVLQVKASHRGKRCMNLNFSRDCTMRYVLPDEVDKDKLVATWFTDYFLVIHEEAKSSGLSSGKETVENSVRSSPVSETADTSGGSSPVSESSEQSGRSSPVSETAGKSGGSSPVSDPAGKSGGSSPVSDPAEKSGGSSPVSDPAEKSGGSSPVSDPAEKSGGSSPVSDPAERFGGSSAVSESSETSGGSSPVVGNSESSEARVPTLNSGNRSDAEESGSENDLQVPSSKETGDLDRSEINGKREILKPVLVNRYFKPFVDVDEILDRFASLSDRARLAENYILNCFFTTPNVVWEKLNNPTSL